MTPELLAAIQSRADAYDLMTDAEVIFDEKAFKRGYALKAHLCARDVPALLAEVERLRDNLGIVHASELADGWDQLVAENKALRTQRDRERAVIDRAKAWRDDLEYDDSESALFHSSERALIAAVDALQSDPVPHNAGEGDR